jgi:hypothetical protein
MQANQTNLAIKGIVGIKAMAVIAGILGDTEKSQNYSVRRRLPAVLASLPREHQTNRQQRLRTLRDGKRSPLALTRAT